MSGRNIYSIGQKIGSLVLITGPYQGKWEARCECGREITTRSSHLYRKKSCGCKSISNRFKVCTSEQVISNQKLNHYKNAAKRRGIVFKLTKDEFIKLILGKCSYCGAAPDKISRTINHSMKWNGVDRKDSSKGYNKENCVSCCSICNRAKSNLEYSEFIEWIERLKVC
jgi:5-methylcytosine-specific restriction endonuclease McrA